MLTVEVEFLSGVSVATSPFRREEPEWPPHPDRLYQALVAAWGRVEPPEEDERKALEWLESLDSSSLILHAPRAGIREVSTVFVPPNDVRTPEKPGDLPSKKKMAEALLVLPDHRTNRQARVFPSVIPFGDRPVVQYCWAVAPGLEPHLEPLRRLAKEVTYLGHSHTLVRVYIPDPNAPVTNQGMDWLEVPRALRVPHVGRLEHLRAQHTHYRQGIQVARPAPSRVTVTFRPPKAPDFPSTLFDSNNLTTLVDAGGFVPTLSAFPIAARRLRDALLGQVPSGTRVPTILSGHNENGRPTEKPHISILPIADVGWEFSQGRLMGLFLAWPKGTASQDRRVVIDALATFLGGMGGTGLLHFGRMGIWSVQLDSNPEKASLTTGRYVGPSRTWGTVLPAVLDRYPKNRKGNSVTEVIVRSLLNVGLTPEAIEGIEVEVHRDPPLKGAPSLQEVASSLPSDSPYLGRPLVHLLLTFEHPIRGPLVVGAGRYRGLGLCMSVTRS